MDGRIPVGRRDNRLTMTPNKGRKHTPLTAIHLSWEESVLTRPNGCLAPNTQHTHKYLSSFNAGKMNKCETETIYLRPCRPRSGSTHRTSL